MASKIIKEAIIMLLACLIIMLTFIVVLYEFRPSKKIIPEIAVYKATEQLSEQLADNVDAENEQVVLTYEVTASDLNSYKAKKDYVPGKENPFSSLKMKTSSGGNPGGSKSGNKDETGNSGDSGSNLK